MKAGGRDSISQRTYHVPFRSVFQGLDHLQSLFEPHLLNQVCSDSSKFLERSNIGISEKSENAHRVVSAGVKGP